MVDAHYVPFFLHVLAPKMAEMIRRASAPRLLCNGSKSVHKPLLIAPSFESTSTLEKFRAHSRFSEALHPHASVYIDHHFQRMNQSIKVSFFDHSYPDVMYFQPDNRIVVEKEKLCDRPSN